MILEKRFLRIFCCHKFATINDVDINFKPIICHKGGTISQENINQMRERSFFNDFPLIFTVIDHLKFSSDPN